MPRPEMIKLPRMDISRTYSRPERRCPLSPRPLALARNDSRQQTRLLKSAFLFAAFLAALIFTTFAAGCNEEPTVKTTVETTPTTRAPVYQRQSIPFFRGIDEPHADSWQDLLPDRERLRQDGFNIVSLSPPVLITQRAGGKPRIILEGEAGSVPGLAEDLHRAGLAVFIAPTTDAPGYKPEIEVTDATLRQLTDDATHWAETAEQQQAELFSPLANYNLALGTGTANQWSAAVLPLVKQKYHGSLVARVVPDISATASTAGAASAPRDFEQLDFRGYDYLMLDVYPKGETLDQDQVDLYFDDLLKRANDIARRDGLKGVLIQFGGWREAVGTDKIDGPVLGEEGQALLAERAMQLAKPQVSGIFWRGWTLPGRGAKGYKVEDTLGRNFQGL
ncbi:MAG: hypothetical protein AABZ63_06955 [Actinomycetota bacterium]